MYELKTKLNDASVAAYIASIKDDGRRRDCEKIIQLMQSVTRCEPQMWGTSIVGFGRYFYRYDSGQEGHWMLTAFSNRVQSLTLYIMAGFARYDDLMAKLGKYKTGKSCLYVKSLDDIDMKVLKTLVTESVKYLRAVEKKTLAAAPPKEKRAAKKAGAKKKAKKAAAGKKAAKKKITKKTVGKKATRKKAAKR